MNVTSPAEAEEQLDSTWGDSPWISFGIRVLAFVVPILLSVAVTWTIATQWDVPSTISGALVRFAVLGGIAIAVAGLADRGARRFLPLAALFRLSLVFPDQAPSRFAIALRSGNTKRIEQRLAEVESGRFAGSQADAAELIVEYAAALSKHDRLTRGHSERVRAFTALIGEEMGLSAEDSNKLQWAGLIHDVGKLRIDQSILTKPGKLTAEEFEVIKTHPEHGMKLAEPMREYLGEWIGAVGEHHERFDGTGYPNGLAGTDISLAGRVVAVADAYDVITAARSYKKPLSPEFARHELADNAGTQFDPAVVRAFLAISIGQLRRAMWPLSWAAQLPFLGTAITTPVVQTVAAAVVTLATATGVTALTDGFEPMRVPEAIAMVDTPREMKEPLTPEFAPTGDANGSIDEPAPSNGSPLPPTTLGPVVQTTTSSPSTTVQGSTSSTTTVSQQSTTSLVTTTVPTTTTVAPTTTTTTQVVTSTTNVVTTTSTTTTTTPPTDCERAQALDMDLRGANLRYCDFTGLTLLSPDMRDADLTGAKFGLNTVVNGGSFENAILDQAAFDGADVKLADFTNARLDGATIRNSGFESVNLTRAVFRNSTIADVGISATMPNADFSYATIERTGFDSSVMEGASFANSSIADSSFTLVKAHFLNAFDSRIERVTFEGAHLEGAKFTDSVIQDTGFQKADLSNSSFASATITNVNFFEAQLRKASFALAVLRTVDLNNSTGQVDFSKARMTAVQIQSATIGRSMFIGAQFDDVKLNGSALTFAKFDGATFLSTSMSGANATGATWNEAALGQGQLDISWVNVSDASFAQATGKPSDVTGATFKTTTCPDGKVSDVSCW